MLNTLRMGTPIEEYRKLGIMHGEARKRFKERYFFSDICASDSQACYLCFEKIKKSAIITIYIIVDFLFKSIFDENIIALDF